MLGHIKTVVEQIAAAALSVVGLRFGTEEPRYTTEPLAGDVEIRRHGPRIAAETTVERDERAARSEGFRRWAGSIFGDDHDNQSIKMTAPVGRQSRNGKKIDMTAPVAQLIQFLMPSKWTM